MTGSESGVPGRAPSHGADSAGAPMGKASRARGSTESSCTGVGGASAALNSMPVVTRSPARIGVIT